MTHMLIPVDSHSRHYYPSCDIAVFLVIYDDSTTKTLQISTPMLRKILLLLEHQNRIPRQWHIQLLERGQDGGPDGLKYDLWGDQVSGGGGWLMVGLYMGELGQGDGYSENTNTSLMFVTWDVIRLTHGVVVELDERQSIIPNATNTEDEVIGDGGFFNEGTCCCQRVG